MIIQCIKKAVSDECICTVLLPIWRSAYFWPFIFPDGKSTASFVKKVFQFQHGILTRRNSVKNDIFDGRHLKFGLLALKIVTTE